MPKIRIRPGKVLTWQEIFDLFVEHGFSKEEATKAADEDLQPEDPKVGYLVKKILNNRKSSADYYLSVAPWKTWEEVVEDLDRSRRAYSRDFYDGDEMNLFVEGS